MINSLPPSSATAAARRAAHKKDRTHAALDASNWQAALAVVGSARPHTDQTAAAHHGARKAARDKTVSSKKPVSNSQRGAGHDHAKAHAKAGYANAQTRAKFAQALKSEHSLARGAGHMRETTAHKAKHASRKTQPGGASPATGKAARTPGSDAHTALEKAQNQAAASAQSSPMPPSITKTAPVNGARSKSSRNDTANTHNSTPVPGRAAAILVGASPVTQGGAATHEKGKANDKTAPLSLSKLTRGHDDKQSSSSQNSGSLPDGASLNAAKLARSGATDGSRAFADTLSQTPATLADAHTSAPLSAKSLQLMAAQIQVLHQGGGGQARIRLDPPSLGSVRIQLQMQPQNQAQVSFSAAQQTTAQALQASLGQLTTAMHQAGVHLVHSEVNVTADAGPAGQGAHSGAQGQSGQSHHQAGRWDRHGVTAQKSSADEAAPVATRDRGVRAYA